MHKLVFESEGSQALWKNSSELDAQENAAHKHSPQVFLQSSYRAALALSPLLSRRTQMLMLLSSSPVGKGSGVFPLRPNLEKSHGVSLETDNHSLPYPKCLPQPHWSRPWTGLPLGAFPPSKAAPVLFTSTLPDSLTGNQSVKKGDFQNPSLSSL